MHEHVKEIEDLFLVIKPVGSRVTCDPPPTDTDQDWLCLRHPTQAYVRRVNKKGWSRTYGEGYGRMGEFKSYRKGDQNLIITDSFTWFHKFLVASQIAKQLNLLYKSERISLFDYVMEGIDPYTYVPITSYERMSRERKAKGGSVFPLKKKYKWRYKRIDGKNSPALSTLLK